MTSSRRDLFDIIAGMPQRPEVSNLTFLAGGGEAAPHMAAVRRRVLNATKAAGVKFLNACNEKNVIEQLKDGVMICTGGDSPAADIGRKFTNRTDPF